MKRPKLVKWIVAVGVLVGVAVFGGRHLVAWFTGGDGGGGTTSKTTRAVAGSFTIEVALRPDPPNETGNTLLVRVLDAGGKAVEGAQVGLTYVMSTMTEIGRAHV